ncbi:Histone-lysine N-methyltransferase [Phytophthora cinnamomi]|uniref:Histone-lysine N-methyltransferase n=1 Tax=Phytophthora cinnamomi TaxID=4785 RepID=UPI003559DFBC|nr:Histone-lysine N-methyltransferase [Phytophthora cinnamomi]
MTTRRAVVPYSNPRPKQKHRPAPFEEAPPTNLKSMNNSERGKYYRQRRKLYGTHIERCVVDLREEIAALTVTRQVQRELALSQQRTPLGAAAHIVSEYCSMFSRGAPVRLAVNEQEASAALVAQSTSAQRGFLHAVMTEDVRFGEYLGIDLVLAQWERYSLFHAAIEWTMKSLDVIQLAEPREVTADNRYDDGPLVVAIGATLRVRFSRRTIEEVFPHLVGDEALTQSLIGLEVTYPSNNQFHFNRNGKIEWYAVEADYAGALLTALKDPMLVARIMGEAVIVRGHMIGDEDDGRQLAPVDDKEDATETRAVSSPAPSADSFDLQLDHDRASSNKHAGMNAASDEEPSPESSPSRMGLDYILSD